MQSQAIRITIELPQAADVQATFGETGGISIGAGESASGGGIDAGPPSATLVATLGDPEMPTTLAVVTDERTIGSADAIDAGSFPAQLALDMEAKGPRHPLGHPEIGMLATGTSAVLSPEARN